ncbi:MAG: hypothetical protein HC888_00560 [Candidatus Competibacteraceae bacterium]|nr:hypothetical protein [Candidatus Competibacteraceae bacterium]
MEVLKIAKAAAGRFCSANRIRRHDAEDAFQEAAVAALISTSQSASYVYVSVKRQMIRWNISRCRERRTRSIADDEDFPQREEREEADPPDVRILLFASKDPSLLRSLFGIGVPRLTIMEIAKARFMSRTAIYEAKERALGRVRYFANAGSSSA